MLYQLSHCGPHKQFGLRLGQIWIQTVWHFHSVPDFFFEKVDSEKSADYNKSMKNYPVCKELKHLNCSFMLILDYFIVHLILALTKTHRIGGNRNRYQQSTNVDQKSIETVFLIAICRQGGDKWQSKTLFLMIFDLHSSMVLTFLIAAYPVWKSSSPLHLLWIRLIIINMSSIKFQFHFFLLKLLMKIIIFSSCFQTFKCTIKAITIIKKKQNLKKRFKKLCVLWPKPAQMPRLEVWGLAVKHSPFINLTAKTFGMLIRLLSCAGWSVLLLYTVNIVWFY